MSANLESTTSGNGGVKSWLHRPPYIGLVAFLIVFVVQALGHTVMIMMAWSRLCVRVGVRSRSLGRALALARHAPSQ
jgi:hypothetical protein